jgi:hypothetical protein
MSVALEQFVVTNESPYSFNVSQIIDPATFNPDKWLPISLNLLGADFNLSVVNAYRAVETPLIKVMTKLGYSVLLSPEQSIGSLISTPAFVWRKAKELMCGQWLIVQLGGGSGIENTWPTKRNTVLDIDPPDEECKILWQDYPTILTVELAEWLGYFMADGFIIRQEDSDLVGFIIDLADDGRIETHLLGLTYKLFKLGSPIEAKDELIGHGIYHGQRRAIYWPTAGLGKWLVLLLGENLSQIPVCILRGGIDYIRAFLRGLFTAKCEPALVKGIRIFSKDLKFLQHIQSVLASLGIIASIHTGVTRQVPTNREYIYYLSVVSIKSKNIFADTIGFFDSRQQDRLKELQKNGWNNDFIDVIPYEVIETTERTVDNSIIVRANARSKVSSILDKHKINIINKYAILEVLKRNQFYDQIIYIEHLKSNNLGLEFNLEHGDNILVNNFIIQMPNSEI